MCIMCDGASRDEALFDLHGKVLKHGWAVMTVWDGPGTVPWSYSIGLAGGFGHPELAVVGLEPAGAWHVLNSLGERVRAGEVLDATCIADIDGARVPLADVHPAQFEHGTFAAWEDYYGSLGPPYPDPRFLEVVVPDGWRCPNHLTVDRLLTRPEPLPQRVAPRRADRRAAARSRRRRVG